MLFMNCIKLRFCLCSIMACVIFTTGNKRKTWYRMLFCLCGITWKDMMKNNLYFIICSVLSGIIA